MLGFIKRETHEMLDIRIVLKLILSITEYAYQVWSLHAGLHIDIELNHYKEDFIDFRSRNFHLTDPFYDFLLTKI